MRCAPCAGEPLSKWLVGHALGKAADLAERRAVFVDEISCIGCKQCVWCGARPAGPALPAAPQVPIRARRRRQKTLCALFCP